jgi:general stress protein CsbA
VKYAAIIGVWLAVTLMVVGVAASWGYQGRGFVVGLAVFGYLMALVATAGIRGDKSATRKAEVTDG